MPSKLIELSGKQNEFSATQGDHYELPATQGFQCQEYLWVTALPFSALEGLFAEFIYRQNPDRKNPLAIVQRSINWQRVAKLVKYIVRGVTPSQFYILPPVVVSVDLPEQFGYEFYGYQDDEENDNHEDEAVRPESGVLVLPAEASFSVPEGQHRVAAVIEAYRSSPAILQNEMLPIMLVLDTGGRKGKQIFLDVNRNLVKPSQSIIALFDNRDEYCDVARSVLLSVGIFEDRVSLEGVNPQEQDLFTMNALKESSKYLLAGIKSGDKEQIAIAFWEAVSANHPHWQDALSNPDKSALTLRKETISFSAIALNALAIVGNQLYKGGDTNFVWTARLSDIDWKSHQPDWDNMIRYSERIVKNSRTTQLLSEYISSRVI